MKFPETKLRAIYLAQMLEITERLAAAEELLTSYSANQSKIDFDSAALQIRKALEATAYASIVPNKPKYEAFRARSEGNSDFTRDFNATKIFQYLKNISEDFYPMPLLPAEKQSDGSWHFDDKKTGFLKQKQFQRFYDRLGKFLHADNPWGTQKQRQNLAPDMRKAIDELRSLLELHAAFIRSPSYNGVWVVEVPKSGRPPHIIRGVANGPFRRIGS